MRIWYMILLFSGLLSGFSLIYLSWRISKFHLPFKNKKVRFFFGFLCILCLFLGLSWALNRINGVFCLICLAGFWILSDLVFKLIELIRKKTFRRYYAGWTAIFITLLFLSTAWYLNHHIWITHYTITTEKNIKNLRIVHFADSHIGTTFDGDGFARHVQKMQDMNPDIVLITGDFIDNDTPREEMISAAAALGKLQTTGGVYFSLGNHDTPYSPRAHRAFSAEELRAELEKNNVTLLQDGTKEISDTFLLIGRKDAAENRMRRGRASMAQLTQNLDKTKFIIVMDHQPNDYQNQIAAEIDLVLSGHTHGGQLWPFNKIGEFIGANDKTYGYERRGKTDFIVTSGLSDWALRFKTGTKSEFVVIDIQKSK